MLADKNRRIIVLGDLHGMNSSLTYVLSKINTILHAHSLAVLC